MTKATQFELEAQMQDRGYARFLKQLEAARVNESQSNTHHGRELIKGNIDAMVSALDDFIEAQDKIRRKSQASMLLAPLNREAVCFIALKGIVNSLGRNDTRMTTTAVYIGRGISNAIALSELSKDKEKKGLVKHIKTTANKTIGNDNTKEKAIEDTLFFFNTGSEWSVEDQLKVGVTLIELAITIGLIEKDLVGAGKDSFYTLAPTANTVELIDILNLCPEFTPVYLPMVVQPADWDEEGNGGYLTLKQPMVKTRFEGHVEALQEADLSSVRESINIIQSTAWKVHTGLLRVAQEAYNRKLAVDGFPFSYKDSRAKRTSLRVSSSTILNLAEEFKDREAIWFPHNMDWRGRVYPMVNGLSPQGNSLAKALLSFADGKRLPDGAESFLAIHIANEYGNDKVSLSERVSWVYDNEETILSVANDPFGPNLDFWLGADSPWGFLRGCLEWSGYCEDPDGFRSTLPVAFDGSCSGLQHFSAMFRDEVGGRQVNLIPDLDRQDIYSAVKDAVVKTLEASEDDLADKWLSSGLLTRSLFKTPTMTYGYSSEIPGMTTQIKDYVNDLNDESFDKEELFLACNYLAKITFSEIENVVVKAAEAKTWLQACVRGKDQPAKWTTPDGLVIVQNYKAKKWKRVDILVAGNRLQTSYFENIAKVDTRKMASAISPNVIHSLDATHIRMVAKAAAIEQIHSLALIHDSFGCNAADAGRFFNIIREQFVDLYKDNVADWINEDLSGGSIELPAVGSLDLLGIVDTDYSFS